MGGWLNGWMEEQMVVKGNNNQKLENKTFSVETSKEKIVRPKYRNERFNPINDWQV
jgi:hypothetical protein